MQLRASAASTRRESRRYGPMNGPPSNAVTAANWMGALVEV